MDLEEHIDQDWIQIHLQASKEHTAEEVHSCLFLGWILIHRLELMEHIGQVVHSCLFQGWIQNFHYHSTQEDYLIKVLLSWSLPNLLEHHLHFAQVEGWPGYLEGLQLEVLPK